MAEVRKMHSNILMDDEKRKYYITARYDYSDRLYTLFKTYMGEKNVVIYNENSIRFDAYIKINNDHINNSLNDFLRLCFIYDYLKKKKIRVSFEDENNEKYDHVYFQKKNLEEVINRFSTFSNNNEIILKYIKCEKQPISIDENCMQYDICFRLKNT